MDTEKTRIINNYEQFKRHFKILSWPLYTYRHHSNQIKDKLGCFNLLSRY